MSDIRSAAVGVVEVDIYYTLRIYWRDGAVLHSSGLFEHQGSLVLDWYGSTAALPCPLSASSTSVTQSLQSLQSNND